MDFISASLGTALDEIYQRLIDCNFGTEDPVDRFTFTVALPNAMGREGRGYRPTEVALKLAFGESGTPREAEIGPSDGDMERCLVTTWLVSQYWANEGITG